MYRERKRNKIIIFSLLIIFCLMTVGYAAFSSQLNITGTTDISSSWDIKIISADVTDTNGTGENVKNTYNDLSASLEANLYEKGDYVEYSIIVENKGTFDAKLETIGITNNNNEAVKITSTGLTKGQTLYQNSTATLKVKIEYNHSYEGDASGTSGEAKIDLDFVQNSGGINPETSHLVTYDYSTNGGTSTTAENTYVKEGESINLSYTATKEGYEFMGWNTNKDAQEGLTELTMETSDVTLYAIFKKTDTTPPIIENVSTSSTTNSITVVVTASDEESGISKYEFKINDNEWVDNGTSNTYTFTDLSHNTGYDLSIRITNGIGLITEKELGISIELTDNVVTTGDGLYADNYESGRYIYKGASPNNYVSFNNELWRIMAIESDGSYKIIKNNRLEEMVWDEHVNNWLEPSDINTYLNEDYYNSLNNRGMIEHNFNIGAITETDNIENQFTEEKSNVWKGKVGLISASEYIRANSNTELCGNFVTLETNRDTCKTTNYLYIDDCFWTITAKSPNTSLAYAQSASGRLYQESVNIDYCAPRPVVYLKSTVNLIEGMGTSDSPYILGNSAYTSNLDKPTFSESGNTERQITITYPEGDNLIYEYKIGDGDWISANQEEILTISDNTFITARVSDGVNVETSTYSITLKVDIAGQVINVVKAGDGLYEDNYEAKRYFYRGVNPNNYITFNNELWRILSKEVDGTYKIIKNEVLEDVVWDSSYNDWKGPSNINTYLNETYYSTLTSSNIIEHNFNIGAITKEENVEKQIKEEKYVLWSGKVGLISASEYIRANSDTELCGSFLSLETNRDTCKTTNYLYLDDCFWTITAKSSNTSLAYAQSSSGRLYQDSVNVDYCAPRPVVYLSADIEILSGTGQLESPYVLK